MGKILEKFAYFAESLGLAFWTIIGVIIGVILGFILRPYNISQTWIDLISYPGEIFARALQLLVLPLIISSLIFGSASLNAKLNGKIALRTLLFFFLTSFLNAIIGVILAISLHPGNPDIHEKDIVILELDERKNTLLDNVLDLGRNLVPSNIFESLFLQTQTIYEKIGVPNTNQTVYIRNVVNRNGTNSLGIIVFSMIFGTILGTFGESAKPLISSVGVIDKAMMKFISGVIKITPLGVASIIASKVLTVKGLSAIINQLGFFVLTVSIGLALYQFIILPIIYFIFIRKNPFKFYIGMMEAIITAFSTASAAVTLPVTFRCMERLKCDSRITHFILPIGASINKNGTALFVAVSVIFIAQMNRIDLGFGDLAIVTLTSTAVSIAAASIPSASLALMFIILNAIGVPTHDIGLLFATDWFLDRLRTTNNLLGDAYAAVVVEKFSQEEIRKMDLMEEELKSNRRKSNPNGRTSFTEA